MYPEVPIALRMSGHLLLGIVRIYSKQVEYLYQDCSVALIGLANSLNVNQPEGVSNAQTFSVIVPKCCELDKVELGDITRRPGNDHVKSPRKITLPDTPPFVYEDPDELPEVPSESGSTPMDEDPHPVVPENPPTNNQGPDDGVGGNTPATDPSIEKIREAPDKTKEFPLIIPNPGDDVVKPDGPLEGILTENKELNTPPFTKTPPGGPASGSHESSELPSGAPQQAPLSSLPGHGSSEMVVRDTPELILQPTPPVEQQWSRKRRRKMEFYDEITVLSNRIIKNSLEDTSNLIRAKRMRRCDKLGIWKQQTRLKKDSMFTEPLITGLSPEILRSPRPNMSPPYMPMPSPSRPDENTPPTTPKSTPPINHYTKSPYNSSPAGRGVQNTAPSDIPEWTNSPGGLNFLNQDSPPAGTPDSIIIGEKEVLEFGTLPATTRAVGQYLKRKSSGTPHSEYSSEILSLHSILENKTRKTCARMFFETLVLKSFGFVDVQQEEPYTDINLKVTSKLKQQGSH